MILFIDEQTQVTFNGEQPYVFWYENGQSTNINYVKRIFFALPHPTVTITLDSPVFSLLDPSSLGGQIIVNGHSYYDINTLTTTSVTSTGAAYTGGLYVHVMYVLARTNMIGEHIDTFRIYSPGQTLEGEYLIGADFYTGDELMTSNITNRGLEIPPEFQKAIYDVNVREDMQDNIIRNRKFKELLHNYFDIVVTQGSYSALSKSLEWWEYGDLVKMRDFWKHYDFNKYFYEYIQRLADGEFTDTIRSRVKSTYIGIYFALDKYRESRDGLELENTQHYVYDDTIPASQVTDDITVPQYLLNEPVPVLEEVIKRWTTEDITLKMTVLGDFYRTYFTPIHLDLQHSTVERLVYASVIKILEGQYIARFDHFDSTRPFECEVNSDYQMQTVDVYMYDDTLFRSPYHPEITPDDVNNPFLNEITNDLPSWYNSRHRYTEPPVNSLGEYVNTGQFEGWVGVEYRRTNRPPSPPTPANTQFFDSPTYYYPTEMHFGGIGCVVDFHIRIEDPGAIVREVCTWLGEGEVMTMSVVRGHRRFFSNRDRVTRISQNVYPADNNNVIEFDFSLLFRGSGDHNVLLEFDSTSGHTYCKQLNIHISDAQIPLINVFKIERDEDALRLATECSGEDLPAYVSSLNLPLNLYSVIFDDASTAYAWRYAQFVSSSDTYSTVGLNHYVVLVVDDAHHDDEGTWTTQTLFNDYGVFRHTDDHAADVARYDYVTDPTWTPLPGETVQEAMVRETVQRLNSTYDDYWWWSEEVVSQSEFDAMNNPVRSTVIRGLSKFFCNPNDPRCVVVANGDGEPVYSSDVTRFMCDWRFLAIFHKIVSFLSDYTFTVADDENIIVVPSVLRTSVAGHEVVESEFLSYLPMSYGAWEFTNISTGRVFRRVREDVLATPPPDYYEQCYFDVETPFVFDFSTQILDRGFYNVRMYYRLGTHPDINTALIRQVNKDSAFAVR